MITSNKETIDVKCEYCEKKQTINVVDIIFEFKFFREISYVSKNNLFIP